MRLFLTLFTSLIVLSLNQCSSLRPQQSTPEHLNEKLLYVNQDVQTVGYQRLQLHNRQYSNLDYFLKFKGNPDYISESRVENKLTILFYYLQKKQLFALHTENPNGNSLRISKPIPIKKKELEFLQSIDRLRKKQESTLKNLKPGDHQKLKNLLEYSQKENERISNLGKSLQNTGQ